MKEEFIHYIWKHKLFDYNFLVTTSGEKIEVINIGEYNSDAGPDFFNAKVKIGNTLWAGNVEIHINSSDWIKHNHHKNKAYDNVILQVVLVYDTIIKRTNGEIIPAVELKFDKGIYENYQRLQKNELWIPCQNDIKNLDKFIIECWLSNLLIERIEKKSEYILRNLAQNIGKKLYISNLPEALALT